MSLYAEEEKHLQLKVKDALHLATTVLCPLTITLACAQSSDRLLLCLWGRVLAQIPAGVHCCCWQSSPDVHGRPATELAVGSLSLVGWPSGHHHPACPPACSSHLGLPQGILPYRSAAACSEGSSGALCPDLYTIIVPVTPPCDQGHDSLGLPYKDLNNACFKECVGDVMYSGHLAARRDD